MSIDPDSSPVPSALSGQPAWSREVSHLLAEVFEVAPMPDRRYLLEQLLRPLGVLSLVAIAGGIFAKIRFRGGWPDLRLRIEDLQDVQATHVVALVDHAQQVSVETVDQLAQWLGASPLVSGSAAAALLVTLLVRRARLRQPALTADRSAAAPGP